MAATEDTSAKSGWDGNWKGTFVGKYTGDAKLPKVEGIKDRANYLQDPLKEEMDNDEIFVSGDAVVVLKYHGSYMQDNRELRKKGEEKKYSFMLRLKSPAGEIPPNLYRTLDKLSNTLGQGDLRATTRQAWQMHGATNLFAVHKPSTFSLSFFRNSIEIETFK